MLRAARRIGRRAPGHGADHASSPPMPSRRNTKAAQTPTSPRSPCPPCAPPMPKGLVDAVDAFCEGIAFSPAQMRPSFAEARALGLPVKLHAEQLSNLGGAALAARHGALSADHLEYLDEDGIARDGRRRHRRRDPARRLLHPARNASAAHRAAARSTACRWRWRPTATPAPRRMTSLTLAMNMACTLFRLTPEEALLGTTAHAARALGLTDRGTHRRRACAPILRSGTPTTPPNWPTASAPPPFTPASSEAALTSEILTPGAAPRLPSLSASTARSCRANSPPRPAPASRPPPPASPPPPQGSAAVYGVNTGFGKLASLQDRRREDTATLQRNLILSHCCGVGEPMPRDVARLMMALKLLSLGRGASGVRLGGGRAARSDAGAGRHPGDPGAGLGRRLGRSRPAGPYGRRDDRRKARRLVDGATHARRRSACGRRALRRSPSARRKASP